MSKIGPGQYRIKQHESNSAELDAIDVPSSSYGMADVFNAVPNTPAIRPEIMPYPQQAMYGPPEQFNQPVQYAPVQWAGGKKADRILQKEEWSSIKPGSFIKYIKLKNNVPMERKGYVREVIHKNDMLVFAMESILNGSKLPYDERVRRQYKKWETSEPNITQISLSEANGDVQMGTPRTTSSHETNDLRVRLDKLEVQVRKLSMGMGMMYEALRKKKLIGEIDI